MIEKLLCYFNIKETRWIEFKQGALFLGMIFIIVPLFIAIYKNLELPKNIIFVIPIIFSLWLFVVNIFESEYAKAEKQEDILFQLLGRIDYLLNKGHKKGYIPWFDNIGFSELKGHLPWFREIVNNKKNLIPEHPILDLE